MCHQSVGLIQGVVEKAGIPGVSVSLLREVTREVNPSRALFVDYPMGYPLGGPNDPSMQKSIITAALSLLESPERLPILREFLPTRYYRRRTRSGESTS